MRIQGKRERGNPGKWNTRLLFVPARKETVQRGNSYVDGGVGSCTCRWDLICPSAYILWILFLSFAGGVYSSECIHRKANEMIGVANSVVLE